MRLLPAPATPASKATAASKPVLLTQQLTQLQDAASVVAGLYRSANRIFYKHVAELYMWWRDARDVQGYLEAAYATTGKKHKSLKQGINFSRLFWLAWGPDNGLTDDKANRCSRVLNKLHELYESQEQYHTDSVAKLGNYLDNNGGINGLVGYGKTVDVDDSDDDGDDDDEVEAAPVLDTPLISTDAMLAELFSSAKDFYCAVAAPSTVVLDATIPLTADGLGLVLVRKVGSQYQLIGASRDDTMVRPVAVQTYLHDYTALPQALRVVVETLSTQCLPRNLQKFYNSLEDDAAKSSMAGKVKSVRRLLYMHASDEILLSPVHAESGVVTIAKPQQQVFANAHNDICLSTRSRRAVERRLIADSDFNFFQTASVSVIPEFTTTNLASHLIRLQHRFVPNDYVHMDFWPFYTSASSPSAQLAVSSTKSGFGTWQGRLSSAWFRKFALEFTTPWLSNHGLNITRDHQKVFLLAFGMKELTAHFICRNGLFENEVAVGFDGAATAGVVITVCMLSKDFAIAMQAVADLGVVSEVNVEVDSDVFALRFSTAAADYRLYIPTCTEGGVRSSKHFKSYVPATTAYSAETFETFYDPADEDGSGPEFQ